MRENVNPRLDQYFEPMKTPLPEALVGNDHERPADADRSAHGRREEGAVRSRRGRVMAELRVTQVRSTIGAKPKTRGTMRALGLRGIGQSNTLPDRPEIRGMIARVPHLITVDEVDGAKEEASS